MWTGRHGLPAVRDESAVRRTEAVCRFGARTKAARLQRRPSRRARATEENVWRWRRRFVETAKKNGTERSAGHGPDGSLAERRPPPRRSRSDRLRSDGVAVAVIVVVVDAAVAVDVGGRWFAAGDDPTRAHRNRSRRRKFRRGFLGSTDGDNY